MLKSLPPIKVKDAALLILGSMPGEASLRERQYYAHPQNAFWKIMTHLFGKAESYPARIALLKKRRIALWDVIGCCERKGSLDTAIQHAQYNDLKKFLKAHPKITRVLLNGGTAYSSYVRYAEGKIDLPHTRLPSTSPAHTMKFELKMRAWKKALRS